ncbi:MAG: lactate utilization protein [Kiritimatiellae bacterium]|nr:lactate utilization protein [Kiritimatiellia bacterium]
MESVLHVVAENLKKRGFDALVFNTKEEAAEHVLSEAANLSSVGWGGSESVKALGVRDKLISAGKEIRDHELVMDIFLLSANALTVDGRIVNIDGRGNRIAASISGPSRVIYVVGKNKIVDGGIDEAIARIKREACPPNCRRLNKKTPCASTGICANCDSPDRICKVTAVFDRKPTATPTLVILVNESLGY